MRVDRDLLIRFLRQNAELGGGQLTLEKLSANELLAILRDWPAGVKEIATSAPEPVPHQEAHTADPGVEPPASVPTTAAPTDEAGSLTVLAAEAAGCTRCGLSESRQNVVFGIGDPAADVVIIGEAPGRKEDRTGEPFVGRAGKLLDLLLLSGGLDREDVYICNVLKCRPPRNRDPEPEEVEACSSFLHRQLELIAPRVLLAAGKFAAQMLTGSNESISRLRGRDHTYRGIPVVATYHPSYLLRRPEWTRVAWQDVQRVLAILDRTASGPRERS